MISDASWTYVILLRWVHVLCAGLLIGGTFFIAFLWPGRGDKAEESSEPLYLRSRRGFKMLVHSCVLLLLISGVYNAYGNWGIYALDRPLAHGLFGPHLLLGLIVFAILLIVLAHKAPGPRERTWLRVCVLLLFLTVLIASSLKYVRDHIRAESFHPRPVEAIQGAAPMQAR